ncbi:hypothetical protein DFH11DRAFT_1544037 [Phellopilus nigrolimitatus]|nr:hypothetical protein DFH11DRAFT_1544037 [Phellopilus nigrolimitatus]
MAPLTTILSSLYLDVAAPGQASYTFESASLPSPTTPQSEDVVDHSDVAEEDPLTTRTIVLIILGIALLASVLLALYLFSHPDCCPTARPSARRAARSSPTASRLRPADYPLTSSVKDVHGRARPIVAPAMRSAPVYIPAGRGPARLAPLLRSNYGSGYGAARSAPGPIEYAAPVRASFDTCTSTTTWTIGDGEVDIDAQPPSYYAHSVEEAAYSTEPAHVCAVPERQIAFASASF